MLQNIEYMRTSLMCIHSTITISEILLIACYTHDCLLSLELRRNHKHSSEEDWLFFLAIIGVCFSFGHWKCLS